MRVAEIAYSSSSRSIIRLTSGSVRKFVREWAAKTEQAKDAGRPRTRRYGADRGHRHATVCSRPGTQRNLWMGPLGPADQGHAVAHAEQYLHRPGVGSDVLVEANDRRCRRTTGQSPAVLQTAPQAAPWTVEHAAAPERVVGDDQPAPGKPGQHRFVVVDVALLLGVDE